MAEPLPQRSMSKARQARLWLAFEGKCAHCGAKVQRDGGQLDHIIAREAGGTDLDGNFQLLCVSCHKTKTRADHATGAKIKRIIAREEGTRRPRKAIQSPGFNTSLTKGFDGRIRPRKTRVGTQEES